MPKFSRFKPNSQDGFAQKDIIDRYAQGFACYGQDILICIRLFCSINN